MLSDMAFIFLVIVPCGTLIFDLVTLALEFDDNGHLWNLAWIEPFFVS
jgi:hypothetical protein